MTEGGRMIPDSSTIHFDEISKKRIFTAIDSANFSDIKLIKENYTNLKYKLGHIPALADFDKYGEMDVFISKKLASRKKIHELELLMRMLAYKQGVLKLLKKSLKDDYHIEMTKGLPGR